MVSVWGCGFSAWWHADAPSVASVGAVLHAVGALSLLALAGPRARKRGGSNRYPRRPKDTPAVQKVTHRIELHPLNRRPTETSPLRENPQRNPTSII